MTKDESRRKKRKILEAYQKQQKVEIGKRVKSNYNYRRETNKSLLKKMGVTVFTDESNNL